MQQNKVPNQSHADTGLLSAGTAAHRERDGLPTAAGIIIYREGQGRGLLLPPRPQKQRAGRVVTAEGTRGPLTCLELVTRGTAVFGVGCGGPSLPAGRSCRVPLTVASRRASRVFSNHPPLRTQQWPRNLHFLKSLTLPVSSQPPDAPCTQSRKPALCSDPNLHSRPRPSCGFENSPDRVAAAI